MKAGFNTMHQYIHKVSNTAIMSPTDIWKLSDLNIKPQSGWQAAAGIYHETAGKKYELRLDSAALHDIYGITHVAGTYSLQVKTPSDYSTLRVKLTPFTSQARIQVLNKNDEVVRELPATEDGAFFEYLKPDTYYVRMYLDMNGDGKWTTGAWAEKRQPDPVYYFPQKIQTKSNWDFEEEWDYTAIEQTAAKPRELIKSSSKK